MWRAAISTGMRFGLKINTVPGCARSCECQADGNVRLILLALPPTCQALGFLRHALILLDEQLAARGFERHAEFVVA